MRFDYAEFYKLTASFFNNVLSRGIQVLGSESAYDEGRRVIQDKLRPAKRKLNKRRPSCMGTESVVQCSFITN